MPYFSFFLYNNLGTDNVHLGYLLQILIEVDHLQDARNPYLQIKGVNKEAVAAAGFMLKLDGSYTTKVQPLLEQYRMFVPAQKEAACL